MAALFLVHVEGTIYMSELKTYIQDKQLKSLKIRRPSRAYTARKLKKKRFVVLRVVLLLQG